LVKKCEDNKIRDVQLFAASDKYEFYEKHNFEKRPLNAPGMQYKTRQLTRRSRPKDGRQTATDSSSGQAS
jgi:hypothetical protein